MKLKHLLFSLVLMFSLCGSVLASERSEYVAEKLNDYSYNIKHVDLTDNINEIVKKANSGYDNSADYAKWIKKTFYERIIYDDINKLVSLTSDEAMDVICHFKGDQYSVWDEGSHEPRIEIIDHDYCEIAIYNNDMDTLYHRDVTGDVEIVAGDSSIKSQALDIVKAMDNRVFIADLDIINHYLHYKENTSTFFVGDRAKNEFKDVKELIRQHPEFNIKMIFEEVRRGTTLAYVADNETYFIKDGIIYGFMQTEYFASTLFFVPKGTKVEDYKTVLLKRLKDYVGDEKVTFELTELTDRTITDENGYEYEAYGIQDVSDYAFKMLKIKPEDYYKAIGSSVEKEKVKLASYIASFDIPEYPFNAEYPVAAKTYSLKMNDKEYEIGIMEAPTEEVGFGLTESVDFKTGVRVETKASNVPLDAILTTEELELDDTLKEFMKKNNLQFLKGYDLVLFSETLGDNVSSFSDKMIVYFPISEDLDLSKVVAVFFNEKGETETHEITEKYIGKQRFGTFETSHFSAYSLVEKLENPKTSDNYILYLICGGVAVIGVGTLVVVSNKKKPKTTK